ncbi:LexA family protein [Globicatella sanguinis]
MVDIKWLRKRKNLTQEEVAERVGVTKATVSKWEKGDIENMKRDKIAKLSEVFEISPLELLGIDIPKNAIPVGDIVQIPVLGYITCGEPILADENVTEYREVFNNDLPKGNLFCLQAKGDSMEPKIPDGSYVTLRKQPDVESGEIAAVIVNGDNEATLKRVRKLDDTILLEALNEKYAPYIINENNPARIIGKAVKVEYKL